MAYITYEFEELSILSDRDYRGALIEMSVMASGRATLDVDEEGAWCVDGISIDPKWRTGKHGLNANYPLPRQDVLFAMIEAALREHCENDIMDEIRQASENERDEALLSLGDRDWHDGVRI